MCNTDGEAEWLSLRELLHDIVTVERMTVQERLSNAKWVVEGKASLAGHQCCIRVAAPEPIGTDPPKVFYLNQVDSSQTLPHIEPDGFICYTQEGQLTLDPLNPIGSLVQCTKIALTVLEDSLANERPEEITNEFCSFWAHSANCLKVEGFVTPDFIPKRLTAQKSSKNSNIPLLIADKAENLVEYYGTQTQFSDLHQRAIYIPLRPESHLNPPLWGETWSATHFRSLVQRWGTTRARTWIKKELTHWKRHEIVIFGLPINKEAFALFGVWFAGVHGAHPLSTEGESSKCIPLHIARKDRWFLLPRGGGDRSLSDKKVCLVGCGSVGSTLATELVCAGIREMLFIDPDTMKDENTYRHVLGRSALEEHKSTSLAEDLAQRFPYTSIHAMTERAERLIAQNVVVPSEFDAFIVAVDNMTSALHLNRALNRQPPRCGVINAWVDPMGLGGHVLVSIPGKQGCIRCLFTSPSTGNFAHNRASFVAEGQSIEMDLGGCGNRFTPFGMLDANLTANYAARKTIELILGQTERATLQSWKGDADSFRMAGYTTSDRYSLSQTALDRSSHEFVNSRCPECSSPHHTIQDRHGED